MILQGGVRLDELSVYHIIFEYSALRLFLCQAHFRGHPRFVPLNDNIVLSVNEICSTKNVLQLVPWVFVQEYVETLYEDYLVRFCVKFNLVLLRVFFGMVKIREACHTILAGLLYVIHESIGVECKLCSSSSIKILRVFHLVKFTSVIVIPIHCHNQCLNSILFL